MKAKYALLTTVLTVTLSLPSFGQQNNSDKTKTDMKKLTLSGVMGKPTVDATVEGLRMKVWLKTQKQYKKMMKGKMGRMMMGNDGMDKATMDAMMTGTHHVTVVVTDSASGKEISDAGAKILIVFPSKKNSSIDLEPMMNDFGSALSLKEKGDYQFTIVVKVQAAPTSMKFQYRVK